MKVVVTVVSPALAMTRRVDPTPTCAATEDHVSAAGTSPNEAGIAAEVVCVTSADMLFRSFQARTGLAEGGIPIGAALFGPDGELWGRGHNRRVQDDDASVHGETAAFRAAGRQRSYRGTTMVTTLSPCWYCSGLVRQFGISRVVNRITSLVSRMEGAGGNT